WPTEYGGAGLKAAEARILQEEMAKIGARPPLMGMGLSMIGPTLLEFGTEDQKARHLPRIVRGEVQWCQGYSEPGAGSDLASLRTRAEDQGDNFLINGQKIWTSGGMTADWMFALVRTDPDAPKHEGISFVLFSMDQPGVTVRPIRLISGNSPFSETFLDNVIASKTDLVGQLNKGWTIGKRLLQFERSGIGGLSGGPRRDVGRELVDTARKYIGEEKGRITDTAARDKVLRYNLDMAAFRLTVKRVTEENKSSRTPGDATSIFKLVGATLQRDGADLKRDLMGFRGVGWDKEIYEPDELEATREWLWSRTTTIYGGTNEVQRNIIGKRVLGLPD
ncbi:MAG: acyl-CoA dehydrogenase family protein, partial [Pseudomonadales bacterium]|nr:acyl-CoA dehydrogenase family protein [Pseudomonadales bacterium]